MPNIVHFSVIHQYSKFDRGLLQKQTRQNTYGSLFYLFVFLWWLARTQDLEHARRGPFELYAQPCIHNRQKIGKHKHYHIEHFPFYLSRCSVVTFSFENHNSCRCGFFILIFAAEFTVFCAEWLLMVGVGTLETGKVAGTM